MEYIIEDKNKNNIKSEEKEENNIYFKEIKKFIFNELLNKLKDDNDINKIINFIDCFDEKLQKEQNKIHIKQMEEIKNEFILKIINNDNKKLFTKEEFFRLIEI